MCSESERVRFLTQVGRGVLAFVSVGADTKRKQTLGAAAHLRWVIFVFLRMRTAASAEAPLNPM